MPFTTPVTVPRRRMKGDIRSIGSIRWINKKYAKNSWAKLWEKAPITLMPITPNSLGDRSNTSPIAIVLAIPPPRLRMKAGPRNVPVNKETTIILIRVTVTAGRKPYKSKVMSVMMFARPSLSQGTGVGSKLSKPCNPIAYAERSAMRYLSRDRINRGFISFVTADCYNDLVRKAYDSAVTDPSLLDTEPVGAWGFCYTYPMIFYLDDRFPFWTFHRNYSIFVKGQYVNGFTVNLYVDNMAFRQDFFRK